MRKPARLVVVVASLPFLAGCFGVMQVPVPAAQQDREAMTLRGVVVREGGSTQTLEFSELHDAIWTPTSLSVVADLRGEDGEAGTITRLFPITQLDALLVRQLDPGRTSAIIGGLLVGTVAVIALIVTGSGDTTFR